MHVGGTQADTNQTTFFAGKLTSQENGNSPHDIHATVSMDAPFEMRHEILQRCMGAVF
jgi:hypothetical protein